MKKLLTVLFSIILISGVCAQPDPDIAGYNVYINKLSSVSIPGDKSFIWSDTTLTLGWEDGESLDGYVSPHESEPIIGSPIYFINDSSLWGLDTSATGVVDFMLNRGMYEITVTAVDVSGYESGHSEPIFMRMIRRARVPINLRKE